MDEWQEAYKIHLVRLKNLKKNFVDHYENLRMLDQLTQADRNMFDQVAKILEKEISLCEFDIQMHSLLLGNEDKE